MSFVLDASVTAAWCFKDESSEYARRVLRHLEAGRALVPAIWTSEVANTLVVGERRGRLEREETPAVLLVLGRLPIQVDEESTHHALGGTLVIAREHGLSTYDASYLELALREDLPLASLDGPMRRAARELGIPLFDPAE